MTPFNLLMFLAFALFSLGFAVASTRRHAVVALLGIELMLHSANVAWIAFWAYGPHAGQVDFVIVILFVLAVAAAETAVGLALIITAYRTFGTVDLHEMKELKG